LYILRSIYKYMHSSSSGADEISGELWQLVTGIHDESDGLKLCEWHSECYDHIHCCPFSVGLAGTDRMYLHSVVVEASLQSAGYSFVAYGLDHCL
jgi:hypothetical protein